MFCLDHMAIVQFDDNRLPAAVVTLRSCIEQQCALRGRGRKQRLRQQQRIGIRRPNRKDRGLAVNAELLQKHPVIQKIAGQSGAHAQFMLGKQLARAHVVSRQIKRALVAHAARQPARIHQFGKSADRCKAAAIDVRCLIEAVNIGQIGQRTVDFPQQHRRARGGAAEARTLPVDDADLMSLRREMLGRERAGNPRPDHENLAVEIAINRRPLLLQQFLAPRRRAAAQVVLPDNFWIEHRSLQ